MDYNPIYITWLGQGGFLFEINGSRLLIDPFISDIVEQRQGYKRLIDSPLNLNELDPDYIFITHDHLDHFDPIALPQIHKKYPKAPIYGPQSVIDKAQTMDFDQSIMNVVSKNKSYEFRDFTLVVTPAYHSDPYSVGVILMMNNMQIYLSADTTFSENLVQEVKALAKGKIDLVLVCINGKLGNMNWQEAVSLVGKIGPQRAIPMHYGMFAENTENPKPFIKECEALNVDAFELIPGIRKLIHLI
ncbi:MBL fold metallo-hydrolase [Arenibacter algicola]|nr:MBL fold metallo-hydrolase [Arenibacter algicola]